MTYLRSSIGAALAATMLSAGPAALASAYATPSPFAGEWELDLTRMPATYGPPPRRVVYAFRDLGGGTWQTKIAITAPDGSVRNMAVRYRRDGQAGESSGDLSEGDSAAINMPAPNVLVMSIAKDKALASVRVYAISGTGREMTESAADVDVNGAPYVRKFHFRRL